MHVSSYTLLGISSALLAQLAACSPVPPERARNLSPANSHNGNGNPQLRSQAASAGSVLSNPQARIRTPSPQRSPSPGAPANGPNQPPHAPHRILDSPHPPSTPSDAAFAVVSANRDHMMLEAAQAKGRAVNPQYLAANREVARHPVLLDQAGFRHAKVNPNPRGSLPQVWRDRYRTEMFLEGPRGGGAGGRAGPAPSGGQAHSAESAANGR